MGCAFGEDVRDKECIQNFSGKPIDKHTLGGLGRKWEDNIKLDSREVVKRMELSWNLVQ
jgi:hypothetical protein